MPRRAHAFASALLLLVGAAACSLNLGAFGPIQPLEETVVLGESGPKIALLELQGVLAEDRRGSPLGFDRPGLLAETREMLDRAAEDDDVAALLLRINSPGGTVSASEAIHHEIARWRDKTGRPVVAFFQGTATSGGYYVAMTADTLIAQPGTVTGSIGVVMVNLNVAGLLEKVGVADQTFKSGTFKDTGSPLREMRPEERELLQKVVDDLHARFKEVVLDGRPEFTAEKLATLADGRIFTARQAEEVGLIDRVGYLEDAVDALEDRLGVEESQLVVYHRPNEYRTNAFSRPAAPEPVVDVDVLSFGAGPLPAGFYYLWPPAAGSP
jgi:protease-4